MAVKYKFAMKNLKIERAVGKGLWKELEGK